MLPCYLPWVRCVTPAKLFAPLSATQRPLKRASMPRKNETLHPPYVYIGVGCTCTVVPVSILWDAFSKKDILDEAVAKDFHFIYFICHLWQSGVDIKRSAGTVNNIFSQWLGKPTWGLIGRSRRKSIYQRLHANGF